MTGVPMVELAPAACWAKSSPTWATAPASTPKGSSTPSRCRSSPSKSCTISTPTRARDEVDRRGPRPCEDYRQALLKGITAAGYRNRKGDCGVLLTVRDSDKQELIPIADRIAALGYELYATAGTARLLNSNMIATNVVRKIGEGKPDILDLLDSGKIGYVISTDTKGRIPSLDSVKSAARRWSVPSPASPPSTRPTPS